MTTCNCEPKLKLRCENVSKTFIQKGNQEVPVIRDVTLDVYENEFLVILGPGQCGKSTLLKIISQGRIHHLFRPVGLRQNHDAAHHCRAGNARHRIRDA